MKKTVLSFLLWLGATSAGANAPVGLSVQDLQSPSEQEITRRARERAYPGGKDEEPLKVQSKMVPTDAHEEDTPVDSFEGTED